MFLADNFIKYLISQDKSKNTIDGYMRNIKGYAKWFLGSFGTEPIQLYRANILDYKCYLQNSLHQDGKTINNKLSALSKYNEFLITEGVQTEKVIEKSDYIKVQQAIVNPCIIDKKDVEEFRQKILEFETKRDYAAITTLAYGGLRISECLNLRVPDVDLINKEIKVYKGKGNKQRIVYINDKIVNAIKEYLKERTERNEFLFVSQKGNKLDRTRINAICNKYSNKITPHQLRHFYCSNAIESGVFTYPELANQAGHSDIRTSAIYTNPNKEKMKEKANKL